MVFVLQTGPLCAESISLNNLSVSTSCIVVGDLSSDAPLGPAIELSLLRLGLDAPLAVSFISFCIA